MASRIPILPCRTLRRHLRLPITLPALTQTRPISAFGYEQAKALVFSKHGDPPNEVLKLHTHSISPAHSNLLTIRFLAAPINPADINQIQGVYPSKPVFTTGLGTAEPVAVGGNEGVAEVISVGDKVSSLKRGDWVIMRSPSFGTWRTHAQTSEDQLLKIDKTGITPVQAGTVSVNPITAWRMLKDFVSLQEGDWFIQNGANSAVGMAAIQLAKTWGYKSINVVRDRTHGLDELKQKLKDLGATEVITDTELKDVDFKSRVKKWTQGNPIKLGLNCVGGNQAFTMAKSLGDDAHFVTYGAMSKKPFSLPAGLLIFKNIRFDGFWVSRWGAQNPEEKAQTVQNVLELYKQGKFELGPLNEIPWDWETKEKDLVDAVSGTFQDYRPGKGIFVFGKT
ncbi:NAD(P)-binding protein [Microthyrium microscopicum]|uniref:enoyl-[acyl-carrier-protein] reductase n=1 Tax=Microthyrium microscopicum TaxID=703497 RepID=A0A6A6U345_9PEZI|nr:NAD(P)-binding protein [Microthyrium microscopicum]